MPGAPSILKRSHLLDGGPPVRLRLVRPADERAVRRLLASRGLEAEGLAVRHLVDFDPARRVVLCALAPGDGRERMVGLGATDLEPGADPDTLVVDERATPGLGSLLGRVLRAQARSRTRRGG
jgi:hypothetical protein